MVRLKQSQWMSMCSEDKKDNYELVIVVHEGHSVIEIIRVSSAWATLKNSINHLPFEFIISVILDGSLIFQYGASNRTLCPCMFKTRRLRTTNNPHSAP
jgi:hypothetical protein